MRTKLAVACLVFFASGHLAAQSNFPSKPIRMLVPFLAGGAPDLLARDIGRKFSESWGQPVIVDNRPSAGGIVAGEIVAKAPPDGYTLMLVSSGHAVNQTLYQKLPYDTLRDFSGITLAAEAPNLLVSTPTLGLKSVRDLIQLAKSKPRQINYASGGIGSGTHMVGEQFKYEAGIDVVHVPFKGTPEALGNAISGNVQYLFTSINVAIPLITSGKLTGLAVTSQNRTPAAPDIPTVSESGLRGFYFYFWMGLVGPPKMPTDIKKRISDEVVRILASQELKDRLLRTQGAQPHLIPMEKFDAFIKVEVERLGKIVKIAGMRAE